MRNPFKRWRGSHGSRGPELRPAIEAMERRVLLSAVPSPADAAMPDAPSPVSAHLVGNRVVRDGSSYSFKVAYTSRRRIDASAFDAGDVVIGLVHDPLTKALRADLTGVRVNRRGTRAVATFEFAAPGGGAFDPADNGIYRVLGRDPRKGGPAGDPFGDAVRPVGTFRVQVRPRPGEAPPPAPAQPTPPLNGEDPDGLSLRNHTATPKQLKEAGLVELPWQGRLIYAKEGEWALSFELPPIEQVQWAGPNTPAPELQAAFDRMGLGIQFAQYLGVKHSVLIRVPSEVGYDQLRSALMTLPKFTDVGPNGLTYLTDPVG